MSIERSYGFEPFEVYHPLRGVVGTIIVNAYERITAPQSLPFADLERFLAPRKLADYQPQDATPDVIRFDRPLGSACVGMDKDTTVIDLLGAGHIIRPVLSCDEEGQGKARQLCLELSRL